MTRRIPRRLYAVVDKYGELSDTLTRLGDARGATLFFDTAHGLRGPHTIATYALVKPVGRKGRK